MTPSEGLLFDVSPIQDEDGKKKKVSKRKRPDGEVRGCVAPTDYTTGYSPGFLMSIDSVPCDKCGAPVDLVEIRKSSWLVMCGWWCMHTWEIDPIPELLKPVPDSRAYDTEFVLKFGLHAGKSLRELWDSGHQAYVRMLPKIAKQASVTKAVEDFLRTVA